MITGFMDNEIPFMGIKEAVIKNTTACDSTQKELLGINTLGDMLLTERTVPSNIGNINIVIQSSRSIYNSGSTIVVDIIDGSKIIPILNNNFYQLLETQGLPFDL